MVRGVLSHNPALAHVSQLPGPLLFHVVCMVGGVASLNAASKRRKAASQATAATV